MRYCEQCGGSISETAKFCEHCGFKFEEHKNDEIKQKSTTQPDQEQMDTQDDKVELEELDLTVLDENAAQGNVDTTDTGKIKEPEKKVGQEKKSNSNIIDLKDILEKEEKVEVDDGIKREVLADDEIFSKVCPMCGEEMEISKQLVDNAPIMVKCLKCGNETKIW